MAGLFYVLRFGLFSLDLELLLHGLAQLLLLDLLGQYGEGLHISLSLLVT